LVIIEQETTTNSKTSPLAKEVDHPGSVESDAFCEEVIPI
jgi:hypothetical protein